MHDRFLSTRTRTRSGARLGRVFGVVRQTWRVADDPRRTNPKEIALASRRSASDAADLARNAAAAFGSHGFHKASGAWWASEGEVFHRFLVAPDRPKRGPPVLLGLGVLALAAAVVGAAVRPKTR
ncbi:MAG: hypothetical protein ACREE0_15325 [Phenylobacterium sp.]